MRRRLFTSLLALVGVLLFAGLAACSGIPRSGPVQAGDAIGTDDDIDVIFLAADPVKGASQQDILNGFILAAKSPQDDYQIARRYLTKSAADSWKPNEGAIVDTGPRPITTVSDTELQMNVTPVAGVNSNGAYTESTSSAPLPLSFGFTQVDGEWRINALADGIVIEDLFFDQVFSSHALYFYDPTFTYLVPDLRWFPTSTAVGTRVVKALLAGPSTWLGDGAVVTAFPDGTSTTSVVTTGGQTQVELSSNVLQADANDLARMQYQLRTSLSDLASASNVTISVDQNIVPIPGSNVTPPDSAPRVDSRALVLRDGAFGYVAGASVAPISGISDGVESLQPQSVAYSATSETAAVKAGNGQVYAVRGGDAPAVLDQRGGLIDPAVDPFGFVWTVPAAAPTSVTVYGSDDSGVTLPTSWDGASGITSLEISRDGTRALAFLSVDGLPKLVVAAVIRNQSGVPQRLGQPVELSTGQGAPVDATWVDQLTVASVTALPSGEDRAVAQVLGGRSSSLGAPVGAVSIAGGNDLDGLRVLSNDGGLLQQRGSAWQATTTGISRLAVQN
ncbi:LpqB family beta-propeller domain-containing protein [Herbiconiux sp. UC225_62]|uniref:LpqB family beta-propeller domain-containing protein n=1 Tax=Herbiconiux sp. UC225_62 TaxID=3350168 RepID=UPI0036D31E87